MDAKMLVEKAIEAQSKAYVPYSNFQVGAAVLTESGNVYLGCNVENASYGLTNCAERTAIFKAVSEGDREIKAIAVVGRTDGPVSPCGACRQVIAEFSTDETKIYLANNDGAIQKTTIAEILPGYFSSKDLNK
ncbi:cytidine deaminase [Mesobacillus zeae]|uniref:Cytidine deaminase n=1 Tax=Mesobacillus zeae TaxID=1917180 RepID=A0A398AZX6_9BACI|nr:cytidine deaminase [Mesobacillus zeae]RID83147.1 cytidine deaminase [Mesobacillus zeae]